jgi:hypothetical protein
MPVKVVDLVGNCLAQNRQTGHRRVLVVSVPHRLRHEFFQARLTIEIREALAEVDRSMLQGELRHHRENGRPHGGQPGGAHRRASLGSGRLSSVWHRHAGENMELP